MSWKSQPRPSFTHVSTHQTYVGKALYEHAPDCATIAAVACMSSSLLKSSLGPNLLALIRVEYGTLDLFDKIFLEYNPHMQLTQKLECYLDKESSFIEKFKSSGPHVVSSLQEVEVDAATLPSLEGFVALRAVTLNSRHLGTDENLEMLKTLPSLTDLTLMYWHHLDADCFKALGDLEINTKLKSINISSYGLASWCPEGFQKDFCGRLLARNRLTKLVLNSECSSRMGDGDADAFVNAGMSNLVEFGDDVPAKLIRGEGFENLRILSVFAASDEDLVNIGNHCFALEVLKAKNCNITGSFLVDSNLAPGAFQRLRDLRIHSPGFSDHEVQTGFARLNSLQVLSVDGSKEFQGSCLGSLPNPQRLNSLSVSSPVFIVDHLRRFVNLEKISLDHVQLSREEILSFADFGLLKDLQLSMNGEDCATSEPFRVLLPQLPKLERLYCSSGYRSKWTEDDVEAILIESKRLREISFYFSGNYESERTIHFSKKFPHAQVYGIFMM